jgi:hypothetical protein
VYLGSFLGPRGYLDLKRGTVWNFAKGTGLSWADVKILGHKRPVYKAWVHRDRRGSNPMHINQSVIHSDTLLLTPFMSRLRMDSAVLHSWHAQGHPHYFLGNCPWSVHGPRDNSEWKRFWRDDGWKPRAPSIGDAGKHVVLLYVESMKFFIKITSLSDVLPRYFVDVYWRFGRICYLHL